MVQLTRPVKLRRTPFRSRQSLRASIIYKGAGPLASQQPLEAEPSNPAAEQGHTLGGRRWCQNRPPEGGATAESGRCRALYSFTPQREDQLPFKEGDRLLGPTRFEPARPGLQKRRYPAAFRSQEIFWTFTQREKTGGGTEGWTGRRDTSRPPTWRSCCRQTGSSWRILVPILGRGKRSKRLQEK